MKKILLIGLIFLFIPIVFGTPSFYFKQSTTTPVIINCFSSEYYFCNTSVACTISVRYPNQTIMINNINMTNSTSYFNYTLEGSLLDTIGTYPVITNCQGVGENGASTFEFEVTSTGKENSSKDRSVGLGLILFFMSMVSVLLYFGLSEYELIKVKDKTSKYSNFIFKRSCVVISFFLLMLTTATINSLLVVSNIQLSNTMFMFLDVFGFGGYIVIIIFLWKTTKDLIDMFKLDKEDERTGVDVS